MRNIVKENKFNGKVMRIMRTGSKSNVNWLSLALGFISLLAKGKA
jgi:hypothetical protein